MSSLVVTGGATYEGIGFTNVDSLIVETSSDPELNPEIESLIRRSSVLGYRPEDRNDILRSVQIESIKKPLTSRGDDGFVIPNSIPQRNTGIYDVSAILPVNLESEKNKAQMKDDQINDADIGDVDGGFEGGDLLFKFEGGGEGSDDVFEGGDVGEYFSW